MATEEEASKTKRARLTVKDDEDKPVIEPLDKSDSESRDSTTSTASKSVPVSGSSTSSSPLGLLTHSDSHEQSSSTDHSVLSLSTLPDKLSQWTRKNIEEIHINVAFQPETSPFDLITRPVPCTGGIGIRVTTYDVEKIKNREEEKTKRISLLTEFVKRSGFLDMIQNVNYTTFEELNIDSLLKLNSYKDHCFLPKGIPCEFEPWFRRFDTYGKGFIHVLSRMVENVVQGVPNIEFHYQHLFDTLVKMFGMQSGISFEPCLSVQTFEIGDVEVSGAPNIIYAHHRINEGEKKMGKPRIVAVCEVTKDKPVPVSTYDSPPSSKTRRKTTEIEVHEVSSTTSKGQQSKMSILQLSEKVIGQHCGELLFNYSQSIGHGYIFGIVVQQTQVSFTELGMTNTQYQKIKDGQLKHGDGDRPTFTYTKPYDFLKKEGLEMLMGSFIKFGLEQEQ
uniref:Uncharacterized protein LOC111110929 isoform X2 n=1 Tax=Crassostrea virginica TaxID=6565 RepID=A0A8B8BIW9_CRAVI|nr:uncharacterized protein LOC111110929 isoform X2 [Crassostrea virginica]